MEISGILCSILRMYGYYGSHLIGEQLASEGDAHFPTRFLE